MMGATCPMCRHNAMTSAAMCTSSGMCSKCRAGASSAKKCALGGSCSMCVGSGMAMSGMSRPMRRPVPAKANVPPWYPLPTPHP
jgi:hypothetical protein